MASRRAAFSGNTSLIVTLSSYYYYYHHHHHHHQHHHRRHHHNHCVPVLKMAPSTILDSYFCMLLYSQKCFDGPKTLSKFDNDMLCSFCVFLSIWLENPIWNFLGLGWPRRGCRRISLKLRKGTLSYCIAFQSYPYLVSCSLCTIPVLGIFNSQKFVFTCTHFCPIILHCRFIFPALKRVNEWTITCTTDQFRPICPGSVVWTMNCADTQCTTETDPVSNQVWQCSQSLVDTLDSLPKYLILAVLMLHRKHYTHTLQSLLHSETLSFCRTIPKLNKMTELLFQVQDISSVISIPAM